MTSPFVDRVEFQVVGRDVNASRVFRDVADAADHAGDEIRQLESLLRNLSDLSANRNLTITTNVREVLGQIEDNRDVLDLIKDRFETLNVTVHATVNQLVELNDGITTIDDNRNVIVTVDDDFRRLTQSITGTVDSVANLNDGLNRVDDNRPGIIDLGNGFDDLSTSIERSRGRVVDLDRDIRNLPGGSRDTDTRRIVETVSSDRDRWERAGLIGGAALAHGALTSFGLLFAQGLGQIPVAGGMMSSVMTAITASGPEVAVVLAAVAGLAAASAGAVAATAFSGALLAGLGGGVLAVAFLAAFSNERFKKGIQLTGQTIMSTLRNAVEKSGFAETMVVVLGKFRDGVTKLGPLLTEVFRAATPLMQPLVDAMLGFAREVLPGITAALRNMKPIFDALAEQAPKLGKHIGEFFEKISKMSPEAASALSLLLDFVGKAIDYFGDFLVIMAKFEPLAEEVLRLFGWIASVGLDAAFISLNAAVVASVATWKFFGAITYGTWELLRFLWDMVTDLAGAFTNLIGPLNGSAGAIRGLAGPLRIAAGLAAGLTGKLFGIPSVDPDVTLHDFASAPIAAVKAGLGVLDRYTASPTVVVDDRSESTLEHIQGALRQLNGKTVTFYVRGVQTGTTLYHGYSAGGAVWGPGPKGRDSRLAMLAPGEHVLTAREVDAAGGQEAVYALRRSLLTHDSLGGTSTSVTTFGARRRSSGVDANDMAVALRRALSGMTLVIDDRSGRTAQLIARGG